MCSYTPFFENCFPQHLQHTLPDFDTRRCSLGDRLRASLSVGASFFFAGGAFARGSRACVFFTRFERERVRLVAPISFACLNGAGNLACFFCKIAKVDGATEERLRNEWAPAQCERFQIERAEEDVLMRCVKNGEPKTAKSHKLSLHNLARIWNVAFDFEKIGLLDAPAANTCESGSGVATNCAHPAEQLPAAIRQPEELYSVEIVTGLPLEFDSLLANP